MSTRTVGQGGKMSRADREKQIIDALAHRWVGYSTHGLARACGLSPSPYFRAMVYSMYERGLINGFEVVMNNRRKKYQWIHVDRDALHGQRRMQL